MSDELPATKLQRRALRMVARLRVRVEEGPDRGAVCEPDDPVVSIGTSPDNALVLGDPTVSRYHLELRADDRGVVLVDLGSSNGSYVGGVRVDRGVVAAGTRCVLGGTTILIEDAGAVAAPAGDSPDVPTIVGVSEAIANVRRMVHRLARVNSSVLIQGETGVGKEVVAHAVHVVGPRRDAPFVVVDCGSMPATLISSQLFGHERGAFTGADRRHVGAFERADGGTVLLDEIGELPLEVQASLLGVLERRRFVRVGGADEVNVDVRILAATHRDLRAEVNRGAFRADLYYRLAVARIEIPPLRERPEDVEPLVDHFAEALSGQPGANPLADALEALRRHPWSGNARELRNVVESAIVMGELSLEDAAGAGVGGQGTSEDIVAYRSARAAALAAFERDYLSRLIEACDGNASEAARRAHMDRPYLLTLLRRHGLR